MAVNANLQTVEITVPVHNEEHALRGNLERSLRYLDADFPFDYRVVSPITRAPTARARSRTRLPARTARCRCSRSTAKGADLRSETAWAQSKADVVSYMDVDLSTNLESFLPLVAPLLSEHSELAIGTRLVRSARVRRRLKREVLSRGYNR